MSFNKNHDYTADYNNYNYNYNYDTTDDNKENYDLNYHLNKAYEYNEKEEDTNYDYNNIPNEKNNEMEEEYLRNEYGEKTRGGKQSTTNPRFNHSVRGGGESQTLEHTNHSQTDYDAIINDVNPKRLNESHLLNDEQKRRIIQSLDDEINEMRSKYFLKQPNEVKQITV